MNRNIKGRKDTNSYSNKKNLKNNNTAISYEDSYSSQKGNKRRQNNISQKTKDSKKRRFYKEKYSKYRSEFKNTNNRYSDGQARDFSNIKAESYIQAKRRYQEREDVLSNGSNKKIKRKTSDKNNKKLSTKAKKFFWILFFIIMISETAWILTHNKIFNVKYVQVIGNYNLSAQDIALKVPVKQRNIFLISKNNIKKSILSLQGIKSVSVHKNFPNKITINIDEQFVYAKVKASNGYYYIDQDLIARKYNLNNKLDISNVPEITGTLSISENKKISNDDRILNFFEKIKENKILNKISSISFKLDNTTAIMKNDTKIEFGELNDLNAKIYKLAFIIHDLELKNTKAKKILLNQGEKPVVVAPQNLEGDK